MGATQGCPGLALMREVRQTRPPAAIPKRHSRRPSKFDAVAASHDRPPGPKTVVWGATHRVPGLGFNARAVPNAPTHRVRRRVVVGDSVVVGDYFYKSIRFRAQRFRRLLHSVGHETVERFFYCCEISERMDLFEGCDDFRVLSGVDNIGQRR